MDRTSPGGRWAGVALVTGESGRKGEAWGRDRSLPASICAYISIIQPDAKLGPRMVAKPLGWEERNGEKRVISGGRASPAGAQGPEPRAEDACHLPPPTASAAPKGRPRETDDAH